MQGTYRLAIMLIGLLTIFSSTQAAPFSDRKDVQEFVEYMEKKHNYKKDNLMKIFANVESSDRVIQLISNPAEALTWNRYRKIFLTKERTEKGVKFWKEHKKTLERTEKLYNVPAEIIVAIIGVETFYGERKGSFPVIEALSTLAFDYPKRADFFRDELEHFLLLAKENQLELGKIEGSYAGAIGIAQFIPSSYRAYAKNFEGKGQVDLINNPDHAIASVANYLKTFGWKDKSQDIAIKAKTKTQRYQALKAKHYNPKPEHGLDIFAKYNVYPETKPTKKSDKYALVEFKNDNNNELWLVNANFYAITRYNHSSNYAMAVYQLAQDIQSQVNASY